MFSFASVAVFASFGIHLLEVFDRPLSTFFYRFILPCLSVISPAC